MCGIVSLVIRIIGIAVVIMLFPIFQTSTHFREPITVLSMCPSLSHSTDIEQILCDYYMLCTYILSYDVKLSENAHICLLFQHLEG